MFGTKKKLHGFKPKVRTKDEIDRDYTFHAVQYAHKARIIHQLNAEIEAHFNKLLSLNEEGSKLPPEPPKPGAAQPVPAEPEAA